MSSELTGDAAQSAPSDAKINAVEFTYRLTGTGWAEARISDETASATITASYLQDALGDGLQAVGLLLEATTQARCSWEAEPGEYRWILKRVATDIHLRVLAFRDPYTRDSDDVGVGVGVFETTQPVPEIASAIADGAQRVLDEYRPDQYLRLWTEAPFPTAHLALIQAMLATT